MEQSKATTAAILVEQRKPLAIAQIELPPSLGPGQVLVRILYSGICGSQLGEIDGVKGQDRYLPHLLGHEGSGEVMAVGPGVKHVAPGQKVVLHWRKGVGIEADPPAYRWNGKPLNAGYVTTFNAHAVVSENRMTRIPDDSDLRVAALFGCAVTTGFGVVRNNAKLGLGESVVVYGAGGIGLNIVQAAALTTADPIIAVDRFDAKLALARQLGATHAINSTKEDSGQRIREILAGAELDVFIDNTGDPRVIELGYTLSSSRGRVVLVGVPGADRKVTIHSLPLHFGKSLSGSYGGEAAPERDIPRYMRLYARGRLSLKDLVTDTFPLESINTAIEGVRNGKVVGRCLIEM